MAFPTTGILDNFNRTNQGPPPTGWTTIYNGHKVAGNLLAGNTSSDANVSSWNTGSYGPSLEVYITVTNASAIPTLYILDDTLDHGYSVVYNGSVVQIYRQDTFGSSETQLGADIAQTFSNGDALGLEYVAATDTIIAYRKPSGGSWGSIGSRTDSTYTDMSRFAIFSWSTASLDDFGGGTTVGGSERTVSVSDSATLSESVTVAPLVRPGVSVMDSATLSESVTIAVSAPVSARSVNVADSATLIDTVTVAPLVRPGVSAADAVTVAESATVRLASALNISKSDAVTVAEVTAVLPIGGACIAGVLTQNATNGRYFENDAGPIVLVGSHTWYNTQDGDTTYPPDAFLWDDYLTRLSGHGHNFTLLWRLESARDWPSDDTQRFGVQPYARTGPGNAADGQPKFDLDTWDDDYFDRVLQRAISAGNAGLYVGVMLFQGFHIDADKNGTPTGDPWAYHPFNVANNINSVDGDIDNDGIGEELRDTTQTALYNRSKAFVAKMIDTLNHLDNVIWEIENEGGTYSLDWQHDLIDYIHTYEAGKPKQHPVGMVKIYPGGSNTDLTTSNAEWISPDDDLTPDAVTSTAQVRAYDTDHSVGDTDTHEWVFRALTRGYGGIWYMDPWYGTGDGDTRDNATYELIRASLGYALDYAARLDLANATPQGSLASTGYCLAKTSGSKHQYIAYQDTSGDITLDLSNTAGVLTVQWLRPATGTTSDTTVNGGASRVLTNPWSSEDAVVYLWQSTYAISVSDALTVSESVTVSVSVIGTRTVDVSDTATVGETTALQITRTASTADSVTVGETVAAAMAALGVGVTDTATVSEAVKVRPAWWLAGGAPAPVATYQPKGAADLADSYVNLANPGTNNAAPGTAPTFNAATGWTFAAASVQYLATGVTPASGWTLIVRYAIDGSGSFVMAGSRNTAATTTRFQVGAATTTVRNYAYAGAFVAPSGTPSAGVQAVTSAGGYYNGALEVATTNTWSGTAREIWIGALNQDGAPVSAFNGTIQAVAIYNATLTAEQIAAVTQAMSAIAADLAPAVSDTATVGEAATATLAAALRVNVTDTATVGESTGITLPQAGVYYVNATDAATVGDESSASLALPDVAVSDPATISETVTVALVAIGTLQIGVSDALTATDAPILAMVLPGVAASDTALVSEVTTATVASINAITIAVSDNVDITETTAAAMVLPGVSVVDNVTVADVIVAYMVGVMHADWTLRDAAPWAWTLAESTLHSWIVSDRSRS